MKRYDAWIIAVIYLLEHKKAHYQTITKYIIDTGLTTLGEKGDTPAQTIGSMLRKKKIYGHKIFYLEGRGVYSLKNKDLVIKAPEVQSVLKLVETKIEEM
jgi:hypothetical protein